MENIALRTVSTNGAKRSIPGHSKKQRPTLFGDPGIGKSRSSSTQIGDEYKKALVIDIPLSMGTYRH